MAVDTSIKYLRMLVQDPDSKVWTTDDELEAALRGKSQPVELLMKPEMPGSYGAFVVNENPMKGVLCLLEDPAPQARLNDAAWPNGNTATIRTAPLRLSLQTAVTSADKVVVRGLLVDMMGVAADLLELRAAQLAGFEDLQTSNLQLSGGAGSHSSRARVFLELAQRYKVEAGYRLNKFPPGQFQIVKDKKGPDTVIVDLQHPDLSQYYYDEDNC